jgi:hypothetical protein
MLKSYKEIPAMKKILVSGNNKITEFIHNFLPLKGYEVIDITQLSAFTENINDLKNSDCIIDLTYSAFESTDATDGYETENTKNLINFAKSLNIPYLFIYQEPENKETENLLISTLDFIDEFCKEKNVLYSKLLVGDIYGTELTTSEKLKDILTSIIERKTIYIENDNKDYYLISQVDFIEGLEESIKATKTSVSLLKTFTLLPEEPLTEIELVHFIEDLNELELDISYSNTKNDDYLGPKDLSIGVNYPGTWFPKIDLEKGLKTLLTSYGIPVIGTEKEELAEEEFMLSDRPHNNIEEFDDPLISMWDDTFNDIEDNHSHHDNYSDLDNIIAKSSKQPKYKKAKTPKKKKAAILGLLLLGLISSPNIFYNNTYNQSKKLISESLSHLESFNLIEAKQKSNTAINKIQALNTNPLYNTMIVFKKSDTDIMLASAEIINNLAINYQYNEATNIKVLGANTFTGIDKAIELINFLDSKTNPEYIKANPEIKSILENKELVSGLKEINSVIPDILGYKNTQKYLVLFINSENTKPFGHSYYYSLIDMKEGISKVEKTETIDDLNSQIILNGAEGVEDINKLLNEGLYLEDGIKNVLQTYNQSSPNKINGILVFNQTEKLSGFESIEKYINLLSLDSSKTIKTLLENLSQQKMAVYFNDEKINIPFKKNSWTGKISHNWDDSLYIIPQSKKNNKLIESIDFNATNGDESYKRKVSVNLKNSNKEEEIISIQFVLPQEAMLTQAMLKSKNEDKNITRAVELNLKNSMAIYKVEVSMGADQATVLEIDYESGPKSLDDGYLTFVMPKILTIDNIPINITFNYLAGIPNTARIPENMKINNNSIQYSGKLDKNLVLSMPF